MSDFGSQIIFKELFERHQRVEVPKIQRDYAQGRESEKDVRDEFLDALHTALNLSATDESLPLNLDFIYGSVDGDEVTRFLPLDGQQRLTTLFLLHWYLSWRDDCFEEFRQVFSSEGSSLFYYSVRPSGTEFFNELVRFEPEGTPETVVSVCAMLMDQPWYFRYWRLDPTIQSSLIMLDAIHLRFKDSKGLFARLTNVEQPAITFQLLDLENFGLSDDLYIKMNARGKPLTSFETFKARFEKELEVLFDNETYRAGEQEFSVPKFFSWRMDTQWADFFWPYCDPDSNVFDEAVMNLFRAVLMITRCPEKDSYIDDISLLRSKWRKNTYSFFHQRDWLDRQFSEALILLLEAWSGGDDEFEHQLPDTRYFDEFDVFSKVVEEPTSLDFDELVQLTAYVYFLRENRDDLNPEDFQEWMRIVLNLSINTVYNRPSDVQRSFDGLLNLVPNMTNVLEYFASSETPVTGFNADQIAEEKIKAQLIIAGPDWRPLIDRAEEHGYFRGQIGFLLNFSGVVGELSSRSLQDWDDALHRRLQTKFNDCLLKAEGMFTGRGLNDLGDFRWERALLTIGDYLLPRGRNHSFLVNLRTDQASWKRLLRGTEQHVPQRDILRDLWESLSGTENLESQLDAIITEASGLEPWRDAFVKTPAALNYCRKRLIRRVNSDDVFLLSKTQMNGYYAELFTYCFYIDKLLVLKADGSLKPLKSLRYEGAIGVDYRPLILLIFHYNDKSLVFEIEFREGLFYIEISINKVAPFPLIESLLLEKLGFSKEKLYCSQFSTPDLIEDSVLKLVEQLASIPSPEQDNV